ncbi:MAG: hypothetical protein K0S27_1487 [Gammaproteobacteria bacterium]|jgi:hypothetical protein|nr:hypothetical protein [Gammaproteobacteria bacterium]
MDGRKDITNVKEEAAPLSPEVKEEECVSWKNMLQEKIAEQRNNKNPPKFPSKKSAPDSVGSELREPSFCRCC